MWLTFSHCHIGNFSVIEFLSIKYTNFSVRFFTHKNLFSYNFISSCFHQPKANGISTRFTVILEARVSRETKSIAVTLFGHRQEIVSSIFVKKTLGAHRAALEGEKKKNRRHKFLYLNQIGLINRFFFLDNMSVRGTYIYIVKLPLVYYILYI